MDVGMGSVSVIISLIANGMGERFPGMVSLHMLIDINILPNIWILQSFIDHQFLNTTIQPTL